MSAALFDQKQRNNITLIIIIILGAFILFSLSGIFGALLATLVMYTIFRPVNIFLIERWKWRKSLSATFIIIGSFFIIVFPFYGLINMIAKKVIALTRDPEKIQQTINEINKFMGDKLQQPDLIADNLQKGVSYAGNLLTSILGGAANLLLELTVMYFLLYFLFVGYREFEKGLLRYSPFRDENAIRFGIELRNITYSNVLGQGFIALIQGGAVALGYWMFDFADPLFWGVICVILSFIPLVGAPLVFVPACIIKFIDGDTFNAVAMLLWGFILVTNIDNVLRLVIAKRVGDIHPIITIIGVIIGIPMFGIMGLVFGPLLLSYFLITVKIYETNRLAEVRFNKNNSGD
ncbi:AI-2E family transporter [Olivibacter sp. SDN3]|uniref:AI-2E family transporter n=1 Tax=Olivibacter sp. SDN3 TaxID=2764720 RepID=UPI0016514008|nr:AI-2E family transporter [Olivibacter sp. SDN3]QNL50706.1 AI-2E family transporter [Olivibacter sp. SDN3]